MPLPTPPLPSPPTASSDHPKTTTIFYISFWSYFALHGANFLKNFFRKRVLCGILQVTCITTLLPESQNRRTPFTLMSCVFYRVFGLGHFLLFPTLGDSNLALSSLLFPAPQKRKKKTQFPSSIFPKW